MDQVVDCPETFVQLSEARLAHEMVDPIVPSHPRVFARATDIEDENVITAGRQLGRQMIVGDCPESGVQTQAMTENHRQLARVRVLRPIVPDAEPPSILGVREGVGTGAQVSGGRIAAHAGTTHQRP
jgi:hypothetical protein